MRTERPEFHDSRIEELQRPLESLVEELLPHIREGKYSLLIGDDTSGRIPTLILRKVINSVYGKIGIPDIPTVFFSPGLASTEDETKLREKAIREYILRPNTRALIATEYIRFGTAVAGIGDPLRRIGIACDIATIGATFKNKSNMSMSHLDLNYQLKNLISNGTRIFIGDSSSGSCPRIYSAEELNGISSRRGISLKVLPEHRTTVIQARSDVNTMAGLLTVQI